MDSYRVGWSMRGTVDDGAWLQALFNSVLVY